MAKVNIDGKDYDLPAGENLLHAALSQRLDLPYFCWHPAMGSVGSCHFALTVEDLQRHADGFPAHAGMDRVPAPPASRSPRLPRTRGDGPINQCHVEVSPWASPHTRGWTRAAVATDAARLGFPAHAGMDPVACCGGGASPRLPRTRGDGPDARRRCDCRRRAFPHTRGWTRGQGHGGHLDDGFPAHAGMDPTPTGSDPPCRGLPRTRGDGPS